MRKKYLAAALAVMLLFSGCQAKNPSGKTDEAFQAEQMNEDLLAASELLPKSEQKPGNSVWGIDLYANPEQYISKDKYRALQYCQNLFNLKRNMKS